eukprot:CAMPEP_0184187218 /NCGR_PEP_ID=MMETSP0976-20121227/819_1 /TAXON_ID=483370 /ORGANISM="non described non described, Strain CCMP2097" /LENGTH=362 /DNA_ID=CAMNT_0026491521 /DNA_START=103 /DNA_END=1188 /DNA_ORIENTATION=+
MQSFGKGEGAEQLATRLACHVFEKQLNIRKAFADMDTSGSGSLSRDEFAAAFVGHGYTRDVLGRVFDLFDVDKTGRISLQEFADSLVKYGGSCPAPPAKAHVAPLAAPPRPHKEWDGEHMTDADLLDELSCRLADEGVPLHNLFRVLCPTASRGELDERGLRGVLEKMGLGFAIAPEADDRAAEDDRADEGRPGGGSFDHDGSGGSQRSSESLSDAGVGASLDRMHSHQRNEELGDAVLRSGDASDAALVALLPLLKMKMEEHGYDKLSTLFLKLDDDRTGAVSSRELLKCFRSWGIDVTREQADHLIQPFDLDGSGRLDYDQFSKFVAMWEPAAAGTAHDRRIWAARGDRAGRVGRIHRLM